MPPSLRFTVAMPRPTTHRFSVRLDVDGAEPGPLHLVFPTWIPGSYLIREFERHVEGMAAEDGEGHPLSLRKTAKNRWQVLVPDGGRFRATWQVFAREWTVRTCHLDEEHGFWNGTSLFPFLEGRLDLPAEVDVEPPPGWKLTTALPQRDDSGVRFQAANFDQLYDCPVEVGPHEVLSTWAGGKEVRIAFVGSGNEDRSTVLADTRTLLETQANFWGSLPYDRYTILFHLARGNARGGLEHMDSTTLNVDRWGFQPREKYLDVLGLISHEHFHVWNVKRLRPKAFVPYDYEEENLTTLLWVMEGWTAYYDNLLVRRSGLATEEEYLGLLAKDLKALEDTPGRLLQSAELSSWDAWIKLYRRDENTRNSTVSYYLKGSLVALCLDLLLRESTSDAISLDDVIRELYRRHALPHGRGIPEDGIQSLVEEMTNVSWQAFFDDHVRGTIELPIEASLKAVGLQSTRKDPVLKATMGIKAEEGRGGVKVGEVWSGRAADLGGIQVEDELIAWNGHRLENPASLSSRLRESKPGDGVELTLFRGDGIRTARVILGGDAGDFRILPREDATPAQIQRRLSWLGTRVTSPPLDSARTVVEPMEFP